MAKKKVRSARVRSEQARTENTRTEKVGRVSSASVQKHTKKNWDQWIAILNSAGAKTWTHQQTVAYLKTKHKLSMWWQQGVAMGYRIAAGLRIEGQTGKGDYGLTVTRTCRKDAQKIWALLSSSKGLSVWLKPLSPVKLKPGASFETEDGFYGEVRTMLAGKRARLKWQDSDWPKATIVQFHIVPRKNGDTIIGFTHEGLQSARLKEQMRERWQRVADELVAML